MLKTPSQPSSRVSFQNILEKKMTVLLKVGTHLEHRCCPDHIPVAKHSPACQGLPCSTLAAVTPPCMRPLLPQQTRRSPASIPMGWRTHTGVLGMRMPWGRPLQNSAGLTTILDEHSTVSAEGHTKFHPKNTLPIWHQSSKLHGGCSLDC